MTTIGDLFKENYEGCSIRSIVTDSKFRENLVNDASVRGNNLIKNYVLDKIAVGGKVLLTGPTGEAKTLFAKILLEHIISEVNKRKYHIKYCPFLEDASCITKILESFGDNLFASLRVLQSLCPFCKSNIEKILSKEKKVNIDNTDSLLKMSKEIPEALKLLEVEKTVVNHFQIDPKNDPESLYMLLAGTENLEQLFSDKTKSTFDTNTHKVGTLSQGFLIVNEIQRLPLTVLESLMGFLEDPQGIKYNITGKSVYVDGVIIFTSNAPMTVFGEESQPIINRIPEVLWPARDVINRIEIVRDMFEEHLIVTRMNIPSNPYLIKMFELKGEGKINFISRLAYQFVAFVASESIPQSVKAQNLRSENKSARRDFYAGLDEIHNPQRSPHIDLRTLNNAIGEVVIRAYLDSDTADDTIITLEDVKSALELYNISSVLMNNGLQSVKSQLRDYLRKGKASIKVEDITEELDMLSEIDDIKLRKIVKEFEGISEYEEEKFEKLYSVVKPTYESLLEISYK